MENQLTMEKENVLLIQEDAETNLCSMDLTR